LWTGALKGRAIAATVRRNGFDGPTIQPFNDLTDLICKQ
jgi:hypothetical protein